MKETVLLGLLIILVASVSGLKKRGWSAGVSGGYNNHGGWSVSGHVSYSWGKREVGPFKVHLKLNPCLFTSYDLNGDSKITTDEFNVVFKSQKKDKAADKADDFINRLFSSLDSADDDDIITETEFKSSVSTVINGC